MRFFIKPRFYHITQKCYKDILECKKRKLEKICLIEKDLVDPCQPSPKVVVVGAGMAGLSAASRLVKAGITDVTVLEATERPGGRIHSCWLSNTVAEIGAQWITDCSVANTVATLASQEGLLNVSGSHKPDGLTGVIYLQSNGRPINKAVAVKAYLTFKEIEKKAYGLYSLNCGREHGTLLSYVVLAIKQELKNFPESQRELASRVMYGQINAFSGRWGIQLEKMSADLLGSFVKMSGITAAVPKGFVTILAPFLKEIPMEQIKYNKVVENIQWTKVCGDDGKVVARIGVKCCDASIFHADYVIITVSLGVLKSDHNTMFTPPLPKEKIDAINRIGFGNTSKIYLEYNRPFWMWGEGSIKLAWSEEELKKRKKEWVTGIGSFEELAGSRQVLLAVVSGANADQSEGLTDQQVAEDLTDVLRRFTGDPSLPYPHSILRSRWRSSPYFLGSTSYMGLESTLGHQCDLSAPVPITHSPPNSNKPPPVAPMLFFAGEATCPKFYSTVNGARLSGLRAAQEIIDLTRLYNGPPPKPGEEPKEFDPC